MNKVTNQNQDELNNAKRLENKIFSATKAIQKPVYELWKSEGFKALGHKSFKDWAKSNQEKFNRSYDSINNDLHTAIITVEMCGEKRIGTFNTYALSPMKKLEKDEKKKLYEHAQRVLKRSQLESKHLTRKKVEQFMKELGLDISYKEQHSRSDGAPKDQKSPTQIKRQMAFITALQKAESKTLSGRLAIALNDSLKPLSALILCKKLLKQHKCSKGISAVEKAIKQMCQ